MNKKSKTTKLFLLSLVAFLLSSCDFFVITPSSSHSGSTSTGDTSTGDTSTGEESSSTSEKSSTSDTSISEESSSQTTSGGGESTSSYTPVDDKVVNIYTSNDFHGKIVENDYQVGLAKYGSFFKAKGEEENTLIIDVGDTWQGSLESNYNHGNMITDVMNYAKFDARAIGNHDFDWGVPYIKENTSREFNGYSTPVLAANIYDYDMSTHTTGSVQQSDLGVPSVMRTLENGLKVGIVGLIGKSQITSITTSMVKDIIFKEHISTIKEEATKLRNNGADIVICAIHAGQEDVLYRGLSDYVDLVLCAHTHRVEYTTEDNVLYLQAGCNGESFGSVTLHYNEASKQVTSTDFRVVYYKEVAATPVDPEITDIMEPYLSEVASIGSQIYATNVNGYFGNYGALANLMVRAIRSYSEYIGVDVAMAYCNNARASLNKEYMSYRDLREAFPFDNEVYVIEVSGSDLYYEVHNYNFMSRGSNFNDTVIYTNQTYQIAVIDFLAFHTNSSRYYDYFKSANGNYIFKYELSYFDMLLWYLENEGYKDGKLLDADTFDSNLFEFNTQNFIEESD